MISFRYTDLIAVANDRPDGYLDAVLSKATRNGDFVFMEPADYLDVQKNFPKLLSKEVLDSFGQPHPAQRVPTWDEMISNFANATISWAKSGFKLASKECLEKRKQLCVACEQWDRNKFLGSGGCNACGCSTAKLYMATSTCPIGKWAEDVRKD